MPTSHHRKKHKQALQHHRAENTNTGIGKKKRNASSVMAVVVGVVGLAIAYFASGSVTWLIIATILGAFLGYSFGLSMDRAANKSK